MDKPLKIVIIETGGRGGIAHYSYCLCNALSNIPSMNVTLLTNRNYELDNFPKDFKLVKIINNYLYFKTIFKIITHILSAKPDIIHIQSLISARKDWIFFILARLINLNIIFTAHNVLPHDEFERSAKGMKFALKNIYTSCRALITHSEDNKKDLIKDFNISDDNIFVIPHGHYLFHTYSHPQITKDLARQKIGLSMHDKVVLCFGAIREYKGIQYLIPAFAEAVKETKDARLMIVGYSKHKALIRRLEELIKEYGLQNFVILNISYIPLDGISLYFRACDIAVFPYLHTYGSGALHSAFAFSKPVIVTGVGVFKEMVKEGVNGYIIPPKDIGALAKSIVRCLSMSSKDLENMGAYSLHLAKTEFSWDKIAEKTLSIYEEIRGSQRRPVSH